MGTTRKTTTTASANRANQKKSPETKKTGAIKKETASNNSKKAGTSRKNTSSGNAKNRSKTRNNSTSKSIEEMNEFQDHLAFEQGMTMLVAGVAALVCYLSYLGVAGGFGTVVGGLLFGVFGWVAWLVPIGGMIALAGVIANPKDHRMRRKIISAAGVGILLCALTDLITGAKVLTEYYQTNYALHRNGAGSIYMALSDCLHLGKAGGGVLGRLVSSTLVSILGSIGAGFLMAALLLVCIYLFYGVELMQHLRKRNAYYQEMEQAYEVIQKEDYQKPSYQFKVLNPHRKLYSERRMQTVNLKQMEEQLDQQEKARKENRKILNLPNQASSTMEEIIPDTKAGTPERTRAEIIRLRHQQEEQDSQHTESVVAEEAEQLEEQSQKPENIPIYREEMQQKFGRKKNTSGLLQDTGKVVVEPDVAGNVKSISKAEADPNLDAMGASEVAAEQGKEAVLQENVVHAEVAAYAEAPTEQLGQDKPVESLRDKEDAVLREVEIPAASQADLRQKSSGSANDSSVVLQKKTPSQRQEKQKTMPEDKVHAQSQETESRQKQPEVPAISAKAASQPKRSHQFPPIDKLSVPEEIPGRTSDEELRNTACKLQETLRSFHVNVTMGAVTCGPTVTRYELLPEQGVRVNKITNLSDDLKLSLAATSIRIEAPIPGKAAVGIEVPNSSASPVYFRELLEGDAFQKAKSPVTFAVGKDIAGKRIMTDIAKMPHLLIAGATGSGKSVCINTLIMSILYKADPSDVKLIMIDPKVVELSVYNGIPHLFCPVVTDPKEAAASLNWAVREMMERYNKFKELGVRNISGYNQKIKTVEDAEKAGFTKMPFLVIIVDEFADLMMVASKEVEDAVCRLAQLARAAGIHLVLATQRPSVNVITGVIKANIPSRIAFSVSSAIDSRTILDKGGAEKLLGKGDMLFFPSGYSEPVRVQGAFISDKEVSDVVSYLIEANEQPEYNHAVTEIIEEPATLAEGKEEKKKPDQDEYFEEAGKFVIESERAAAGQLQRRFSIGFNRAGRIIDQLHQAGVIGPAEGTKPRKVLMTMAEFEASLYGVEPEASEGEEMLDEEDILDGMDVPGEDLESD